jgi:hypothetical protein
VSLSSLLGAGGGPVWDWFATHFSQTQRVCTDANRQLRRGPATEPCVVPPVPGTDHGLVGTAVGYLFSAHLRGDALSDSVATHAVRLLDGPMRGRGKFPPRLVERVVVERIRDLRPWAAPLGDEEWSALCHLVCILARFEQYYRAGSAVLPYLVEPLTEHSNNLAKLAAALANTATLDDVRVLGRATVEDHIGIRDSRELHIGPTFEQSIALGGADADLIYDGTLVDLKSTSQARVVGREELWQLLGYLFADSDDTYKVQRVGFAALRRRSMVFWPAQELIDALAGHPTEPLEHWRREFARLLRPLAETHMADRLQRIEAKRLGVPHGQSER